MKIMVDIKEERSVNEACLWNNISFVLSISEENEMDVYFDNISLKDCEYIFAIIGETVKTGVVKMHNEMIIYHPSSEKLRFDFGQTESASGQ